MENNLPLPNLDAICLTHFHFDHCMLICLRYR
ncbi:MAG: MBL fold metallo-hydrolase [Candidatus Ranarchaeia archaeon]